MKLLIFALLLISGCIAVKVRADSRYPALALGMEYHEVLKLWGAPADKREHEIKREDVWIYGGAAVTFKEGKVISWSKGSQTVSEDGETSDAGLKAARPTPQPTAAPVQDLLNEILKEVPDTDAPAAKPGSAAPPLPIQPEEQLE